MIERFELRLSVASRVGARPEQRIDAGVSGHHDVTGLHRFGQQVLPCTFGRCKMERGELSDEAPVEASSGKGDAIVAAAQTCFEVHDGDAEIEGCEPAPAMAAVVSPWTTTTSGRSVSMIGVSRSRVWTVMSLSDWPGSMIFQVVVRCDGEVIEDLIQHLAVLAGDDANRTKRAKIPRNARTTGASLIASGRVPNTNMTLGASTSGRVEPR